MTNKEKSSAFFNAKQNDEVKFFYSDTMLMKTGKILGNKIRIVCSQKTFPVFRKLLRKVKCSEMRFYFEIFEHCIQSNLGGH